MSVVNAQSFGWNARRNVAYVSVSYLALLLVTGVGGTEAVAQTAPGAAPLPPISVEAVRPKPKRTRAASTARRPADAAATTAPAVNPPSVNSQNARSGTVGYVTQRITSATKTNTPWINIPQAVTVLTEKFIQDQAFTNFTDNLRYVPGVIPHQGEGNRDDVVIRGQRSNADFFTNGIRDDVQYFRDVYNVQRIEVLKGPNAMIFGRGGGGGVINRVTKEADGTRVRELTLQGGSYDNKRVAVDVGDAVTANVAARINAVFEDTSTFRDYVDIQRYGVNPTVTFAPTDFTRIKLSFEAFHDDRTTDRGIPSQAGTPFPLNPYNTSPSSFFGNPNLNKAVFNANIFDAVLEHDFQTGLTVKNAFRYGTYNKFYQNIFPGGAVNPAGTSVNLSAYNNQIDRDNIFNQTDWTYKFGTGPVMHTLLMGPNSETERPVVPAGWFLQRCCDVACGFSVCSDLFYSSDVPQYGDRRKQQLQSRSRGRLCAGSDRSHPLAAIHRRRAVRSLRPYQHR